MPAGEFENCTEDSLCGQFGNAVYDRGRKYSTFFWIFNSLTVFGYLVIYTNYLIRAIIRSEKKLREMAHIDRLTKLYNRHYMLDRLGELPDDGKSGLLAMADIDDLKKINEKYGHNAGDEVLRKVAEKMRAGCDGCDIARWGGEPVVFEDMEINVTVTVGMASRVKAQSIDEWIQCVDKKLYIGKNSGKNRMIE